MKILLLSLALAVSGLAQQPFEAKVTGHGPTLILIPGLSSPGEVWDSTVAHYRDRYEVHVLSLAGFAGVPRVPGPFLDNVREGLAVYIRTKHIDKPVIVGHSLGGFAALDLAAHYPDLPGKLVIVDSYPFFAAIINPATTAAEAQANAKMMRKGMESQTADDYARYVKSGVGTRAMVTKDSDLERVIAWGLASDRSAVTDAVGDLFSADLRDSLANIKSPLWFSELGSATSNTPITPARAPTFTPNTRSSPESKSKSAIPRGTSLCGTIPLGCSTRSIFF